MNDKDFRIVWSNTKRIRFFLITDGHVLPPGEFLIQSPDGREQKVDPEAPLPFEVTRGDAVAWCKATSDGLTEEEKRAIDGFFKTESDSASEREKAGPGVRMLSKLTGESADSIQTDHKAALRGIHKLGSELKNLMTDILSMDDTKRKAAQQRLEEIKELFREHGPGEEEPKSPAPDGRETEETRKDTASGEKFKAEKAAAPSPGEIFRKRLQGILEGVVSSLEGLAAEVLPRESKEKPSQERKDAEDRTKRNEE